LESKDKEKAMRKQGKSDVFKKKE